MKQTDLKKALDLIKERDMVQTGLAYLNGGTVSIVLGDKGEFRLELTPTFRKQLVAVLREELFQRDADLTRALNNLGVEDA